MNRNRWPSSSSDPVSKFVPRAISAPRRAATCWALACLALLGGFLSARDADAQVAQANVVASQLRYVQVVVSGGRVEIKGYDSNRNISCTTNIGDRHERLQLHYDDELVSMDYQLTTPRWQVSYEIVAGNQVVLKREARSASDIVPLEFNQPAQGPLSLRIGDKEQGKTYTAPTFWHLLLEEPDVCRRELVPLLQLARPNWPLLQTAAGLEALLVKTDSARMPYDRQAMIQAVAELGDKQFSRRQAAQRRLCDTGQVILPFLRAVDQERLDPEQVYRLQAVMQTLLRDRAEDSPGRIAVWMAADPRTWLALLDREDESLRRLAARQLTRLLDTPIDFDPAGNEATRSAQVERLGDLIDREKISTLSPVDR
jgi:hypothetical protein